MRYGRLSIVAGMLFARSAHAQAVDSATGGLVPPVHCYDSVRGTVGREQCFETADDCNRARNAEIEGSDRNRSEVRWTACIALRLAYCTVASRGTEVIERTCSSTAAGCDMARSEIIARYQDDARVRVRRCDPATPSATPTEAANGVVPTDRFVPGLYAGAAEFFCFQATNGSSRGSLCTTSSELCTRRAKVWTRLRPGNAAGACQPVREVYCYSQRAEGAATTSCATTSDDCESLRVGAIARGGRGGISSCVTLVTPERERELEAQAARDAAARDRPVFHCSAEANPSNREQAARNGQPTSTCSPSHAGDECAPRTTEEQCFTRSSAFCRNGVDDSGAETLRCFATAHDCELDRSIALRSATACRRENRRDGCPPRPGACRAISASAASR
jgi:hypothetical protein